ncbi:EscU/YscU/HrcU family type III secretion system export apparatus switch protein [Peribacillus frigoritolerans]|uniref:EscU/YscU/HrcU family type III secretion system export apparatus switch protein n=1 Tax=Peribacillus frigoritolerans TaxID=450367 RepID=UPI003517EE1C
MINDKRKEAIALKYDQKTSKAPVILAKGKGKTAIMEKAMKLDIPVQRDGSLAALLGQLDINQTIPEELYGAVAEVFAFIYKVDMDMNR